MTKGYCRDTERNKKKGTFTGPERKMPEALGERRGEILPLSSAKREKSNMWSFLTKERGRKNSSPGCEERTVFRGGPGNRQVRTSTLAEKRTHHFCREDGRERVQRVVILWGGGGKKVTPALREKDFLPARQNAGIRGGRESYPLSLEKRKGGRVYDTL